MLDDIDMMLLFLLYRRETKKNSFQVHSRYRKKFLKNLGSLQRRLRQRRIPRVSLQDASQSAWKTLFNSGNDQALITLTGLTFEVFNWLLPKLSELYDTHSPFGSADGSIIAIHNDQVINRGGRPRMMKATDCLGMCLAWTRTRGSSMVLQITIFGMTATSVSLYLRFGRRILVEVLKNEPLSAIGIPSIENIRTYQAVIRSQQDPAANNVAEFARGVRMNREATAMRQSAEWGCGPFSQQSVLFLINS
ncbi:hypothetical protein MHU86_14738 [Fragilaria crotonensis]|nr:hypothetical protein MHU86_14738 [Fragilaria crotonensis]